MSRTREVAFALGVCSGWQTVRQSASRTENAIRVVTAGKAGSFLLDVCRSRQFYRCGAASPCERAAIGQKRAKFGLDAKTGRMYHANRKPVRRALKREQKKTAQEGRLLQWFSGQVTCPSGTDFL